MFWSTHTHVDRFGCSVERNDDNDRIQNGALQRDDKEQTLCQVNSDVGHNYNHNDFLGTCTAYGSNAKYTHRIFMLWNLQCSIYSVLFCSVRMKTWNCPVWRPHLLQCTRSAHTQRRRPEYRQWGLGWAKHAARNRERERALNANLEKLNDGPWKTTRRYNEFGARENGFHDRDKYQIIQFLCCLLIRFHFGWAAAVSRCFLGTSDTHWTGRRFSLYSSSLGWPLLATTTTATFDHVQELDSANAHCRSLNA